MTKILLATLLALPLHAATRTWTGAVNQLWSNAGNWQGGVPAAGDDLAFTDYDGGDTVNDLPAGTMFRSILASGGEWTFAGNAIGLTHGLSLQSVELDFPIALGGSQVWTAFCCHTPVFRYPIDLNGHTLTLRNSAIIGGGFDLSGTIAGPGTIVMIGRRVALGLDDALSSNIDVVVSAGALDMNDKAASVRSLDVHPGATFTAGLRPLIVSERVRLAGTLTLRNTFDGMMLIRNDGSAPVEGRFDVAPPSVTYTGGDGNDVVLQGGPTLIATTTTLASAVNPAHAGAPVSFTATVVSSSGPPSGTVTFRDDGTPMATLPLDASGQASFSTSTLSPGTHFITATFDGSSTHAVSTSAPLSQVITGNRRRVVRHGR